MHEPVVVHRDARLGQVDGRARGRVNLRTGTCACVCVRVCVCVGACVSFCVGVAFVSIDNQVIQMFWSVHNLRILIKIATIFPKKKRRQFFESSEEIKDKLQTIQIFYLSDKI